MLTKKDAVSLIFHTRLKTILMPRATIIN